MSAAVAGPAELGRTVIHYAGYELSSDACGRRRGEPLASTSQTPCQMRRPWATGSGPFARSGTAGVRARWARSRGRILSPRTRPRLPTC